MAALSDNILITVTVMTYLAAMLLHSAEYAFGRQSHVAKAAARELVGAGGPPVLKETQAALTIESNLDNQSYYITPAKSLIPTAEGRSGRF